MTRKITENEYGVKVSHHICKTCGDQFTITPAVSEDDTGFENCLSVKCASYDPERDIDVVFMSDEELKDHSDVVSLKMLGMRRDFKDGVDVFSKGE